jgi:hypothetical protein
MEDIKNEIAIINGITKFQPEHSIVFTLLISSLIYFSDSLRFRHPLEQMKLLAAAELEGLFHGVLDNVFIGILSFFIHVYMPISI